MPPTVRALKRTIDLGVSVVALVLVAPLLVLIAIAIRCNSKGPVLYRQVRCGRLKSRTDSVVHCDQFVMHKFRTMRVDAERGLGVTLATANDPRITRVGCFLRRYRLDELPQLINVARGSMSLVGPRPERLALLEQLSSSIPLFEERCRDLKPGLTGYAQVSLGYTGWPLQGSPAHVYLGELTNPFGLLEASGAVADEMRIKLLFDMAYAGACERLATYLRMELVVLLKTPWIMVRGVGR